MALSFPHFPAVLRGLLLLACLACAGASHAGAKAEFQRLQALSELAELRGDFAGAIRFGLQSLDHQPNDQATLVALSGLYGKNEQPDLQLTWARRALRANPREFAALINQGNALMALGQDRAARDSFHKAQQVQPKSHIPSYSLGVLAQAREREAEAIVHFQQALKIAPGFEDAQFNLAVSYANLGRIPQALQILDELLAANPRATDARQMRTDLQRRYGASRL